MGTEDTKETFLLTLRNTKGKMPSVPAHLCECALEMLQGSMRTADVEWGNISQQELAHLVQSMRRTCTAVINAAGGHTRY
jgi:hypothetical protein